MPFQRLIEESSGLDSFNLERKRCLSLRWRSGVTWGVLMGYNCIGYLLSFNFIEQGYNKQ